MPSMRKRNTFRSELLPLLPCRNPSDYGKFRTRECLYRFGIRAKHRGPKPEIRLAHKPETPEKIVNPDSYCGARTCAGNFRGLRSVLRVHKRLAAQPANAGAATARGRRAHLYSEYGYRRGACQPIRIAHLTSEAMKLGNTIKSFPVCQVMRSTASTAAFKKI